MGSLAKARPLAITTILDKIQYKCKVCSTKAEQKKELLQIEKLIQQQVWGQTPKELISRSSYAAYRKFLRRNNVEILFGIARRKKRENT